MNVSTNRLSIINLNHDHLNRDLVSSESGGDVIHLAGSSASEGASGDSTVDRGPDNCPEESRLHKILEEARVAAGATGAAIALRREEEFVCCASSGPAAPALGSSLDPHAGLSGCCIQTHQLQQCTDAETDARVNLEACRRLNVRSIVVLPLVDSDELFGVFELLWPQADAFERQDLHIFELVAGQIVQCVKAAQPIADAALPGKDPAADEILTKLLTGEIATVPARRHARVRRRHHWTAIQTAAVIALSVLLGWLMGRAGWNMAVSRAESHAYQPQEAVKALAQATADTSPYNPEKTTPVPPVNAELSEDKTEEPQATQVSQIDLAAEPSEATSATESSLITRVEPQYPKEAKQRHIQGRVVMNVLVGTDGLVHQLVVVSGDRYLAAAAAAAVRQWRFKPHNLNGQLSEFETQITVNFSFS
ncbi:MAG: TonB family protein [Terriglobales bacterium]